MKVSVVILAYYSSEIQDCVDSLHMQDILPEEIIVVNGGKEPITVRGARVIEDPEGSQAHGRNLAAKEAKGNILACLDSDCRAPSTWIPYIIRDYQAGMKAVGGPYTPLQDTDFAREAHKNIADIAGWRSATFADTRGGLRELPSLNGGNSAYDRELFLSVGGFDERQHWSEEPELGRKIKAKGVKLMFDPELWVYHHQPCWDSLTNLVKLGYFYGRIRVRADRELES